MVHGRRAAAVDQEAAQVKESTPSGDIVVPSSPDTSKNEPPDLVLSPVATMASATGFKCAVVGSAAAIIALRPY